MPKILESEALALAQNIDTLSDAEKPLALDILKRYQEQQWDNGEPEWPTQARSQKEGDARFRSMFEDLKNVDKAAPSLADALQYSDNPDADRARVASIAYLARVNGKPADEIGSSLDLYRNDYTTRRGQKGTDDLGFYKLAAAEVAAMKRKEDTALEGEKAALRGEDVIASLQAWQAKNLDRIPDSTEFTKGYLKAKEEAGDYLPIADELLKLMESSTGKSTRPFDSAAANRLDEIAGELATMKPRERKQVYASISARAEAAGYEQKGFWSQMLGELDKGLYRMSSTLGTQAGIASDVATAVAGAQTRIPDTFDGSSVSMPVLSDEEQQALLRQRDYRERIGNVQQEIMQIVSGELDPVKPVTGWMNETVETGLIKGPGAVAPFMAASALLGPYGAGLVFTADFAEQNRRELVQSGLDADQARKVGAMAAPLQAAVESLSNMVSLGKFPAVQAALSRFTRPVGGASLVGRYVQNSLISGATEFTEEQVQDNVVVPVMQELLGALEKDVPDVDWSFYKTRAANATPELAATLLPMALVFGGVMTNAQANLSRDMTGNIDALKALNYSEAQAVEVVSEKTEDARIAKARSLWASRAGDKVTLESGAKNLAERMRQLSGDAMAQQRELERRGKLPILRPMADGKWLMTIPSDGSAATFDSHQEADKARWTWTEDQLGKVHALTRETLASMEKNLNVGREVAVEFFPDIRTAQDAVNEGASVEQIKNRVEQGKALGDISPDTSFEDAQAIDKATTEADGFLSSLRILGSSKNEFKDGILRTTIKLWEGSNILTLVEEKLEGDAKAIIMEPKGREWMLSRLRSYEQASGDKLFRELPDEQLKNEDLVEAWSHLGQSYLVGRSTFGEPLQKKAMRRFGRLLMRSGLTGAMNAESSFFAAVASRAQKLSELKQAGKLSDDLVSELEKQLGIDSQVSHDAAAEEIGTEIVQKGVDTSGYSPETPGPNGETFSISSKELRVKIEVSPDSTTLGNLGITEGFHANHGGEVVPDFAPRASKQGRKGQYAGFYLGPAISEVSQYGQNVSTFPLNPNTPVKVLRRPGQVERITPEMAAAWRAEGFSVVVGPAIIPSKIEIATLSANVLNTPGPNGETFSVQQLAADFEQKGKFYRVIHGEAAFQDVVESGFVRTNASAKVDLGSSLMERLKARPTAFPSFSKDYAAMSYAQSNPEHFIIVTDDSSLQPSKSGRHSKGKTYFPTNQRGEHLSSLSADKVDIFRHVGNGIYQLVYSRGKNISHKTPEPNGETFSTRDESGKIVPLSQRFNPADNRITFSIRPGDFSARMEAKFSLFQAKPELRLAIAQVAKERALRLGAEWIAKGDVIRSAKDIGKEARMREALAYEARMNEYLDGLSENARQTLEFEPSAFEDDPLVSAMLDFGKLMSFMTAKKSGKVEAKSGDYDGQPWLPPAWFSKGMGIMPDQMAQAMFDAGMLPDAYTGTLWSELEKRIEATRKDKAAHREAVQAYKAAEKYARDASRAEADQWAENAKKQAGSPKAQRDMLKAALRTLDGILAAAPPEVRARVGGYVKLAGLATDEAMLAEIERRIDKLNVELEKYLKKQAVAEISKLFKKARPDMEAGKKGKGKDADMHALFAAAEAAADMDALAVAGRLADLDARIASGELTAEQEALATTERGIVELVGDLKNADSGRAFSALDTLRDIYGGAWLKWKIAEIERKERRAGLRQDFIVATGKAGVRTERTKADKVNESLYGKGKAWLLNLSSMREVLAYAFGLDNERVTSLVDAERTASNTYEDANQRLGDEIEGLFTEMAGTRTKGERLRWNLSQRTIKTGKGELSQLEAIQALLMWRQEDGRRHMEGTRDESGKVTSSWSYDQAWIDEIEAALTPEARQVMSFIMGKYAAEWATLNPLYRARYGVNMPHHDAYAPITVTPVQTQAGVVVDPVTGSTVSSGSILTPGSLRTRSRNAIAEPDFRDALQTMILHSRQMEYWKAYYDLAVEMNAVLGNREVMNSVHAKGGKEAANALRQWIDVIGQGGFRDASLRLALFQAGSKLQGRAAGVALLGRMSAILSQSTQLAAAAVKMPVTSYLVRLAKLMTGGLGWRDAMRSDFIQRRFKTAPPIVRQAMDSLASAKPNEIQQLSRFFGNVLSGADAFFTSGTYAILLDYHREQGRAAGLTGAELDAYAHTEAERATEQVAQPTRTANRSLAELSNTGPLGKIGWAFASEARQKVALAAHAALNAKNDPVTAAKSAFLTFAIGGLFTQVLKNLLREAKGDDDREMWSLGRLGYAMTIAPLASAIPFGSAIAGDSNMLSNIQRAIQTLGNDEVDFRDVDAMLSAAGLFNDTAASLAQLSHLGLDLGKILSNAAD